MSDFLKLSELGLELRVSGVEIDRVRLRQYGKLPIELELVVTDPVLGEFAVDRDAFAFEVREKCADALWRQVTADEALEEIAATDQLLEIEGPPDASERAERQLFGRLDDIPVSHRARRRRRARMGEEGAHIIRAEEVLYQAGIPHILLPVQRDRFASNVIMVPHLMKSKIALCRGGFKQAFPSRTVMVHVQSGRAIRLIEANGKAANDKTQSIA